jgi:hypothetical protein
MAKKKKRTGEKNYSHLIELHAKNIENSGQTTLAKSSSNQVDTVKGPVITTQVLSAEAYLKKDLIKLIGFIVFLATAFSGIYYLVNNTTYVQFLFK